MQWAIRHCLNLGLRSILISKLFLHVGSEGTSVVDGKEVENFALVIDLLKRYPKQTAADISAMISAPRRVHYLKELIAMPEIHGMLFYGSDYPIPAVRALFGASIARHGCSVPLLQYERSALSEIHAANPLLAALVGTRLFTVEECVYPQVFSVLTF